jgi:hypothetical protein
VLAGAEVAAARAAIGLLVLGDRFAGEHERACAAAALPELS